MQKQASGRNGLIDILRLPFAGIVVMYHFYSTGADRFYGGRFCFEFFIILSGFLFYSAWRKKAADKGPEAKLQYWKEYIKKRYIKFFWYNFVAFVIAFFMLRVYRDGIFGSGKLINTLAGDVWEILLVKAVNGFNRNKGLLNGPSWNLGCMVFAEFVILGACVYFERPFLTLILPCALLFGCGYWINMENADVLLSLGFFTFGALRVFLLTCFGIISYWICRRMSEISFSKTGSLILTVIELLAYIICILLACFKDSRYIQFCVILMFVTAFAISFSGKSYTGKMFPASRFTSFCSDLSLALYLTHGPLRYLFKNAYPNKYVMYQHKYWYLLFAILISLIYLGLIKALFAVLPKIRKKLKALMVE